MSISLLFETMTLRLFNPLRKGPTLRGFDWLLRLSMRGTLWNSVPSDAGSALLKTLYQSVGMAHYCLALFPWSTSVIIFSSSVFALSAQRWRKTLGERTRGSDERDTSTQELCLLIPRCPTPRTWVRCDGNPPHESSAFCIGGCSGIREGVT